MSDLWNGFRDLFVGALDLLHGLFSFVGDEPAWGFAIIALTLVVRILMLPLAIKQTHSMRAMQELQPKIKEIQKKYKADRDMLKKDPERYKNLRQKQNEEMQALYQEAGVNPAGGCLPLLAQAPIFIALFSVLRTPVEDNPNLVEGSALDQLLHADFYFFTPGAEGLSGYASDAGFWGIFLIVLMAASMFFSQRQMISKTNAEGTQAQQQKIMMYVMPVFLAVISFNFPMGVLLYWVTTNIWQIAQQAIVLHEVDVASPARKGDGADGSGKAANGGSKAKGASGSSSGKGSRGSSGKGGSGKSSSGKGGSGKSGAATGGGATRSTAGTSKGAKGRAGDGDGRAQSNGTPRRKRSNDHLPSRRSRGERG